ncbi:FHA domain-containing serine/threonine-protein kinase [Dictyobacter arantiisoli]|uniref:non-specific serine/threonine protein kinase n=1 Tax=Dictyobacter arantiisoli TaxID=2014874 RepID=A0A5A5TH57_9CHLR|nr:FHA domain-containing serine/threonine-protein kinase [Dictyobacter arantiisoli]GCF10403.1 hypothetical protein KDI_39670 [Dictyobacter arantiisoli]
MQVLSEGKKFERYRILRPLGSGISASSYLAEDTRQQRAVMLKLIHNWSPLSDAARRRFFRELQNTSSLAHPRIAPILNYGEVQGQLFVARMFIPSGSLLNDIGRTTLRPPLGVPTAIEYGLQIAEALFYIHQMGCVHGSLTHSNILINSDPSADAKLQLMLSDTSLATFVRNHGKPQFSYLPITIAPEQLRGQSVQASDQYALAILLYCWLAGHPPFIGSSEEIGRLKNQEAILPFSHFAIDASEELERSLHRALSAHPKNRYATIGEFAQSLKRIQRTKKQAQSILQTSTILTPQSTQHPEPVRRIEPDAPHPQPDPESTPQIQPATPTEPQPAGPLPPAPDIAPGLPDATPFTQPDAPIQPVPLPDPAPDKDAPQPPAPSKDAWIVITSPTQTEPVTYSITQPETSLGRAGASDILLENDNTISRHHAMICKNDQHYIIYDCRSTDGILINGQKLTEESGTILKNGDQITIGRYTLTFYRSLPPDVIKNNEKEIAHL